MVRLGCYIGIQIIYTNIVQFTNSQFTIRSRQRIMFKYTIRAYIHIWRTRFYFFFFLFYWRHTLIARTKIILKKTLGLATKNACYRSSTHIILFGNSDSPEPSNIQNNNIHFGQYHKITYNQQMPLKCIYKLNYTILTFILPHVWVIFYKYSKHKR